MEATVKCRQVVDSASQIGFKDDPRDKGSRWRRERYPLGSPLAAFRGLLATGFEPADIGANLRPLQRRDLRSVFRRVTRSGRLRRSESSAS